MGRAKRTCPELGRDASTIILSFPDDILLEIVRRICTEDKRSLRLVSTRLRQITGLTIHHITLNDLQYSELTGPDRRSALCLKLESRFPSITSCTFTRIYNGPVSLMPKLLKQLPNLTELDCYNVRPVPAVVQQFSTCRQLHQLHIDASSSRSLCSLPFLPNLRLLRLNVQAHSLSSPSLTTLSQYSTIHTLSIDTMGCNYPQIEFTADLAGLGKLPLLTALTLNWFNGLMKATLSHLTTLTSLHLHGSGITTSSTNSLLHLTRLCELSLITHNPNHPQIPPAWDSSARCNLPSRSPPVFPHLTSLTAPIRLLAGPFCPRTPALVQLQTTVGRADADPDTIDALLPTLPLARVIHFRANIDGLNNNRPTALKLLKLLTTECPALETLCLCGPFPVEAVKDVASLKALRDFTLDTRVMTTSERNDLTSQLERLRLELPALSNLSYCVQLVPPYVLFWNVLQFL